MGRCRSFGCRPAHRRSLPRWSGARSKRTDGMALLDVNALVALAWDSHVHHVRMRAWFDEHAGNGWATCPVSESGFVRVSSNRKVLPSPIDVTAARDVLSRLRAAGRHRFLADDVSLTDPDVPA